MALRMTRQRWLLGAGAGTLLLVGGVAAGPIVGLAQGEPEAQLSREEAVKIATARFSGSTASDVELEEEDGRPVYEVTLSNGTEVEIDGNSGSILETEPADGEDRDDDDEADEGGVDDDEQEQSVPAGSVDDGEALLPQASITVEQAIVAAQGTADGAVGEVDLEYVDGRLVFNVDIGDRDVKVDAQDGTIVSVDSDD